MRYPAACHIVTCLPDGYREPIRAGAAYPPRCPNCGGSLEHYETIVNSRAEWRDVFRVGSIIRTGRPRLVVGAPA